MLADMNLVSICSHGSTVLLQTKADPVMRHRSYETEIAVGGSSGPRRSKGLASAHLAAEKSGVRARKRAERDAAAVEAVEKEQEMLEAKQLCFECVHVGKGCMHLPFATELGRDKVGASSS